MTPARRRAGPPVTTWLGASEQELRSPGASSNRRPLPTMRATPPKERQFEIARAGMEKPLGHSVDCTFPGLASALERETPTTAGAEDTDRDGR